MVDEEGQVVVALPITLWLFKIAMENGPFIDDVPIEPCIYSGFSMAMLNNQRVNMVMFHGYVNVFQRLYPRFFRA